MKSRLFKILVNRISASFGKILTKQNQANRSQNRRYYDLIKAFKIPVVMNTSFNLAGEPIVCTPQDAVNTFRKSGLDALIVNDRLLEK